MFNSHSLVPRNLLLHPQKRYFEALLSSTSLPYIIQDFNPGGASVSPAFLARLKEACPNLKYVKLEEPLLAGKVRAVLAATKGQVGVLEGWGGDDLLRLAYIVEPLQRDPIKTADEFCAKLVDYALAEQQRVQSAL